VFYEALRHSVDPGRQADGQSASGRQSAAVRLLTIDGIPRRHASCWIPFKVLLSLGCVAGRLSDQWSIASPGSGRGASARSETIYSISGGGSPDCVKKAANAMRCPTVRTSRNTSTPDQRGWNNAGQEGTALPHYGQRRPAGRTGNVQI
jgi:hypothetical protein